MKSETANAVRRSDAPTVIRYAHFSIRSRWNQNPSALFASCRTYPLGRERNEDAKERKSTDKQK